MDLSSFRDDLARDLFLATWADQDRAVADDVDRADPRWAEVYDNVDRLLSSPTVAAVVAAAAAHAAVETRSRLVDDIRFLAAARKEYDHAPEAKTQEDLAALSVLEVCVREEHQAASWVANILAGSNDGRGWLPSWRWGEWVHRRQATADAESTTDHPRDR